MQGAAVRRTVSAPTAGGARSLSLGSGGRTAEERRGPAPGRGAGRSPANGRRSPAPLSRRAGCAGGAGLLFGAGGTCSGGGVLLFGAQALVAALLNGGRACRQRGGGAAARAVGIVVRLEAGT